MLVNIMLSVVKFNSNRLVARQCKRPHIIKNITLMLLLHLPSPYMYSFGGSSTRDQHTYTQHSRLDGIQLAHCLTRLRYSWNIFLDCLRNSVYYPYLVCFRSVIRVLEPLLPGYVTEKKIIEDSSLKR